MGECVLRRQRNVERGIDELFIDRADPHVLILDDLLWEAFWECGDNPWVAIRRPDQGRGSIGHSVGEYGCQAPPGRVCFHGSVVTIKATNRTVIYRIGDYDPSGLCWAAQWPD